MAAPEDTAETKQDRDDGVQLRIDRLYRSQAPKLRRSLRARLGSTEEARDLVQDAFARLLGARSLQVVREPEAFLGRIVRNLVIDRGRRRSTRPTHVPLEDGDRSVPAEQEDDLEVEQLRLRYQAAVAALPQRTREVFLLHRVDDLAYHEIASKLGISRRTAEWHVAEAVLRIGRELDRE
ncbi:RNA polymerase sigma factor [Sphingosinicella sp. BN140058]|uniref:RNA polymerase sigma factor n=1 Tax=Sphingosinicella sp. BN140058 TaxID=1892855 RepID=UPI0010106D30|nr:RNA polymerase sigma factor [Sphingosinicella sp. BN140058]QAY78191.1 RNA polymerase sigma factor [Sphingosinicella sp. BN140058]